MADVFISYAHEDRPFVQRLADQMKAEGLSVWWDHTIPPGKTWDEVIAGGITDAKVCIVVWSPHSIVSDWVKEEATLARDAKKLLPVTIDGVDPPVGFRRIQAADLSKWDGDPNAPQWRLLVTEAEQRAKGEQPPRLEVQSRPSAAFSAGPKPGNPVMWAGGTAIAVLAVLVIYFVTRAPAYQAPAVEPQSQAAPVQAAVPVAPSQDAVLRDEIAQLQRERADAVAAQRTAEQRAEEERSRRERDQKAADQSAAEERARKAAQDRAEQDARKKETAIATPVPAIADVSGRWAGQYNCYQGLTGVDVNIAENAGAVNVQFEFHPVSENPGVPFGAFTLRGRYNRSTGEMALQTERWLRQPPGYGMVPFNGRFDEARRTFSGQVEFPGCSWIRLQRQ